MFNFPQDLVESLAILSGRSAAKVGEKSQVGMDGPWDSAVRQFNTLNNFLPLKVPYVNISMLQHQDNIRRQKGSPPVGGET